jgi:hypothetical protein
MKQKKKGKKISKKSFAKVLCQGQTLTSLWAYVSWSLSYWIQQNLNILIPKYYIRTYLCNCK